MARVSTIPTVPDDGPMLDVVRTTGALGSIGSNLESQWHGGSGSIAGRGTDDGERLVERDHESKLGELLRLPALLSEQHTLGAAVEMFANGVEGPLVIVTDDIEPLGVLTPARVMRLVKEHPVTELEQVSVLDLAAPCGIFLEESASPLEAAAHFIANDSDVVVVVKRDGQLAGVLLARDLCQVWM